MTTTQTTLCADCAIWAANRDDSGASPEWLAFMAAHPERLADFGSIVLTCYGEEANPEDDAAPNEEHAHLDFSSAECGGCDTRLAGDRCPAEVHSDALVEALAIHNAMVSGSVGVRAWESDTNPTPEGE